MTWPTGEMQYRYLDLATLEAQDCANRNESPVAIMQRDGWFCIIEEPPDDAECEPFAHGWTIARLVSPQELLWEDDDDATE